MDLRKIFLVLTLGFCMSALADITTLVEAVETTAANLRVPTSSNGFLSFRPCAEPCDEDFVRARLTPSTQYVVGGKTLAFIDFRRELSGLRGASNVYALVSYETSKSTVTSVRIGD